MAESASFTEPTVDSLNEYTGPDKCAEKIATAEDEVISVPSDESQTPEQERVDYLKACARCHLNFSETKHRCKLLPCLHSLCEDCLVPKKEGEDTTAAGDAAAATTECPYCSLPYDINTVLDNLFIQDLLMKDVKPEEAADGQPTIHECTACEEKETGTSFCIDCAEWLCEQCVTAHKRVRVTKDHKIVPREDAPTSDTNKSSECFFYCKQHKQEKLMFFCEKCDALTCRDCQLVEHKDHKYQFLDVAAANYKQTLQDHMYHMNDRSKKLSQVHAVIESKLSQVKTQHAQIVKQVQDQADSLIKQIIQSARQLLQNVKVACETMAKKLDKESNDLVKILGKYDYCSNFVNEVLKDGSNMALLLSKSAVLKECGRIYTVPIEAHSVKNQFVVQYKHDNQFIHNNLTRFGAIFVNNTRYHPQDKNYNANPPQSSHPPSYNPPPNYSSASQMLASEDQKKRQILMALQQANSPHMQSILSKKIPQQQLQQHLQQQQQQQQSGGIPTSVSNLVSQMRMNMPQTNGWQVHQQLLRSNNQAVNLQRSQYNTPQQQPFQPMRLQHRPVTLQSVYSNPQHPPPIQATPSIPKMPLQQPQSQPQSARGPPPLIRSPNQSTTPPSNSNRPSSAGPVSRPPSDTTGLPSGVRVKKERRSSCENDCIITAAKVKGERSPAQACSGASPKPTTETVSAPTVGGTWATPSNISATPTTTHAAETEKNLEKVIEDLPMEDLPTFEDIDTTLLTAGSLNKQLNAASDLSRRPAQSPGKNGTTAMFSSPLTSSDPNEDFCACCHNGGEVLCCDTCPYVYHLQCHIPPLSAVPNGVFVCTLCSTRDIRISSPVPEDVTSNGNKRKAPGGLSDKEIKICERLVLELFCLESSVAFHEPVSKQVPNYYKIIQTPMDFTTIKCKLSRQHFNHYNCMEDFLADVKLVFQNCATYNQENSEVGKAGKAVRVVFEELVAQYLPHYLTFASTYPPRPVTYVNSDGVSDPKRPKTDDPVLHIA